MWVLYRYVKYCTEKPMEDDSGRMNDKGLFPAVAWRATADDCVGQRVTSRILEGAGRMRKTRHVTGSGPKLRQPCSDLTRPLHGLRSQRISI